MDAPLSLHSVPQFTPGRPPRKPIVRPGFIVLMYRRTALPLLAIMIIVQYVHCSSAKPLVKNLLPFGRRLLLTCRGN